MTTATDKENRFRRAASSALELVKDGQIVGLGSGSTVAYFVGLLAETIKRKSLEIQVIPSSMQIQIIVERFQIPQASPVSIPEIDVAFDGADQIDESYNMIKGRGGAIFKERVILHAAKTRAIIIGAEKFGKVLDKPIPVEVGVFARTYVELALRKLGGKPTLRLLDKGFPFLSENGAVILDTAFGVILQPKVLRQQISDITGVIEVGLFTDHLDALFIAEADGNVKRTIPASSG
jgi:ribose 5-phosphate isomerase A